jgi:hypothetical protein
VDRTDAALHDIRERRRAQVPVESAGATPAERPATLTLVAWATIVVSAVLTPISLISLLMILAGGHGTSSTTLFGFLSVVVAPPASFFAGIGLLRRQRWAYIYMLGLARHRPGSQRP